AVHSLPGWSSFDPSTSVTPQEYPGWGGAIYTEPALKVTFNNGNRGVVLHYVDQELKGDRLEIRLKDEGWPLWVRLRYRVYGDSGVIERSARIENRGSEAVTVEDAQSAAWTMWPGDGARLNYLTGGGAGGWEPAREEVPVGGGVWESRRGGRGRDVKPGFRVAWGEAGGGSAGDAGVLC